MTISAVLFLPFIFLGLFHGCLSSNPETVMVQSPQDNEERTGKMQMADLSSNSESVTEQSLDENNDNTDQMETEDLSINPEIVMVQSPEDNNERTGKIQIEDISTNSKGVTIQSQEEIKVQKIQIIKVQKGDGSTSLESIPVQNQEEINERAGKMQMEDPSTNPESEMIHSQVDNNEKIGRMEMEQQSSFNSPSVRYFCPYGGCNQREASYERTSDRPQNITLLPTVWLNSRNRQPNSRPPNNVNRNNNNNRENSRPYYAFFATTESDEEFLDDKNPETVPTKSPGRTRKDANFFASLVNTFAFKLVETLNLESNFVISPLSIFVALSMCYLGSSGKTKTQMEQAFGIADYNLQEEELHQGIKDLLPLVLKETPGYELFVANGMFLGKNFPVDTQFEENVKRYYDAEIKNLDFTNPDSLKFINDWVAKNTRNVITNIINRPPNILTRLVLMNAVFFKGIWKMQFPPNKTYNGRFRTLDRNEKQAEFMRLLDETFPVFRSDKHKHTFLKLPYAGDEVSMIIALPYVKGQKPMPTITDSILYYDVREGMVNTELGTLAIPKFRLEYKTTLKRPLQVLGMTDIFDASLADLTKLRKENDLYLSKITHKAVVEVNEVGTTASAITSDFVGLVYKNKTNFVADHPFAFYIVHEATGLVLFYGKLFDFDSEAGESNDRRGNVPSRARPTEATISNDRRGNVPSKSRPTEGSVLSDRNDNERFKPRPAGSTDTNNRKEHDRFGPRPVDATDSNDRRGNVPSKSRPTEGSVLSDRNDNERFKPRPAGSTDTNNRKEHDRFGPRPADATDSNNQNENGRFGPRPAEALVPNEGRVTPVIISKPAEASDSSDRNENENFKPIPAEASDSNYQNENGRVGPRPAEAIVPSERRGTLTTPRPANFSDSNDRRENPRNRYRPSETSNSNDQRPNSRNRYRPTEPNDSNYSRDNSRSRNRPTEEPDSNTRRRVQRPPQRPSGGSDFDFDGY